MAKKQDGPLVIRGARLTDGVTVWLDHRGDWSERASPPTTMRERR